VLVAAAVCPHPPLLVPEAMGAAGWPETGVLPPGSEADVDDQIRRLRAACYATVRDLAAARPDLIVVLGGGSVTATHPGSAAGTLRDLGIPFTTGVGQPVLPLSLTVGSWLVRHCVNRGAERLPRGADPPDRPECEPAEQASAGGGSGQRARPFRTALQEVARSWPAPECMALGERLAAAAPLVALLVMGDGSARKALGAGGTADPAAERYDAQVASALAAGDVAALAGLDPRLSEECLVTGRVGWHVLAGAAAGARISGQLRYAAAPLGVSYFVALWLPG
jgi:hypothetical protein